MKRIANDLIPVLGLLWMSFHLLSCRTLSTTAGSPPSGPVNGMLYYLPIGKITIKGEFKDPSTEGTATSIPKLTEVETTEKEKNSHAQAAGTPSATPRTARGNSESNDVLIGSASQLTITLTPEVEADESKGAGVYYAKPHANYLYEDDVHVTVNSKHLLSTGNVTTEDRTVEIVGAVASLASQLKALAEGTPPPAKSRLPFYFSFHPSKADEVKRVREALDERGIVFTVESTQASTEKEVVISKRQAKELGENGLLFRPAISYKVKLVYAPVNKEDPRNLELINSTQQFILPDPNQVYEIEYPRMAFVKKVKEIGFTDGMLTDFHQTVPSPILGFLGIPKAIIQAIVPIPGAAGPSGSAVSSGTVPK